jgi:hypothetical protein
MHFKVNKTNWGIIFTKKKIILISMENTHSRKPGNHWKKPGNFPENSHP